jgi:hypothetical protein
VAESWAPGLSDVGRHIPSRTRDGSVPGSDKMLGTFTATTTPTDAQAQQVIDDAVAVLLADVGELPATGLQWPEIQQAARQVIEWRAAADIELAYPNRDADLLMYDRLNLRYADALATLKRALAEADVGMVEAEPVWQFPVPPPWGDKSPGSGTDYLASGP